MENNNLNEVVLDKITKVCVCKAISRATIKEAIKNGADTVDAVKEKTGACTGDCKGYRCVHKIEELIKQNNN